MIRKSIFIILLFLTAMSGNAQTWIDITDDYIINPRFDNNDLTTGWSGTTFGSYNPHENAEHYSKNYDSYQEISGLTAGKYRVSLNAFYRMGSASNDYSLYSNNNYSSYQYAELYSTSSVNEYSVKIVPASSAALNSSLGGSVSGLGGSWGWQEFPPYIPNNMEAAYYWFNAGYYNNTVECQVGSDGKLTVGIRKSTTINGDWTCLDNWKLEYYGTVTKVTSLSVSPKTLEMAPSETTTLQYTILPSNATYKKVSWTSSNTNVATVDVDGKVTAVGVGSCTIKATSIDGSNKSSSCSIKVVQNVPTSENLIINEIMSANVDVYLDPNQNYGSWVELYNPTSKSVTLGGLYVSDDANNLKKNKLVAQYGAIPAEGFTILNFDHHEVWTEWAYRQIDDKLDCDGGEIIISDGTKIIARQSYPQAISRCSYARKTDGGEEWSMTGTPSPGFSNQSTGGFATLQLAAPEVDQPGQLFSGSLQISVKIPEGATLRYTTDGTAPTQSNGNVSTTGLFNISSTTCYRFRLFKNGYLPSPVTTRSYITNNSNYKFPIISIVTDPDNIYDTNRGVFQQGPYGRPGSGQTAKCNWNMDWDRPVSFEYITTDNECLVSQECDFSMCGGWSRAWAPHSFKLKAKKEYDLKNSFNAQFFTEKGFLKHKTLQIRNGGNDTSNRIKDAAIQMVVANSRLNVDYQEWQPAHVFINGSHYAVLNIREPNNKDFAYSNQGIDTDEMDQFEISPDSGYVQMRGSKESFNRLVELSYDAANPTTYSEIKKLLDIDEYINYMAIELYSGNWDWPQNNVKGYRDQNDGKYRFVLFDLDGALSTNTPFTTFFGKEWYNFDTLHGYDYSQGQSVEGSRRYLQIEFVTLFKNMLLNDDFRRRFIDTFCIVGGSVFKPSHVNDIISEMRDYMKSNYVNPDGTANTLINSFSSSYNSSMISQLKNNSQDAIKNDLSSVSQQSVKLSSNITGAKLFINDIDVPYAEFDGYLFAPATFRAVAPAGYKFAGWKGNANTNRQGVTLISKGASWHYYDKGSLDGSNWKGTVNSNWSTGNAPLGYFTTDNSNSRGYNTILSYGNSSSQKYPTYYFTTYANLDNSPNTDDEFVLDFIIDDGFIVYVNGVEAGRYNMPSGTVTFSTYSTSYAPNNPDTGSMTLATSLFKKGANVIAVEVHNNNANSTDIEWEASLTQYTNTSDYISSDSEFKLTGTGSVNLIACFEELNETEKNISGFHPLKVNEISASNTIYVNDYFKKNDWIELYNPTDNELNVAGLYISDDIDQPNKYQIPSNSIVNTIVPAKGYLIIWADKLDPVTQLHTNFKLSNAEGEMVVISSSDEFVKNNAAYFANNPDMKSFVDGLYYIVHNGNESCGRYPDGTGNLYKMSRTTIAHSNSILLDEVMYGTDSEIQESEPDKFELSLIEGWNWVSHILQTPIKPSYFKEANHIVGQNQETYNDRSYGMTGSLSNLTAGNLYKFNMNENKTYTFEDMFCDASQPISIRQGWNWIGYTCNGSQSISSGIPASVLDEGDIIMGQDGFSVYHNGTWTGSLSSLETGKGYMFKSNKTKSLHFTSPDVTVKVRRLSRRQLMNRRNNIDKYSYPNVMGLVARLNLDGLLLDPERFTIYALNNDTEVGLGQESDSLTYITIYGDGGESIRFKAIDNFDGMVYDIKESFEFRADVIGTPLSPIILHINTADGTPTGVISPDMASDNNGLDDNIKQTIGYYSIGGVLISRYPAALQQGIYIKKFNDGSSQKIYIK